MRAARLLFFPARIALVLLLLFLLWQAWVFFSPRPRTYTEAERFAFRRACAQAVERLRAEVEGRRVSAWRTSSTIRATR